MWEHPAAAECHGDGHTARCVHVPSYLSVSVLLLLLDRKANLVINQLVRKVSSQQVSCVSADIVVVTVGEIKHLEQSEVNNFTSPP